MLHLEGRQLALEPARLGTSRDLLFELFYLALQLRFLRVST
jgi:hypothetical protein